MLFFAAQVAAPAASNGAGSALALLVLIVAGGGWLGLRAFMRRLRAGRAEQVVRGEFPEFALHALANAAQLDRRVAAAEREAILTAMQTLGGAAFDAAKVDAALASAKLTKDELVDYLAATSRTFSRDQKVEFLKALLGVFVADGRFEENEHRALIEYTAAVGFDRDHAPNQLRGLLSDMSKGRVIT